jgi:hypothetical protein
MKKYIIILALFLTIPTFAQPPNGGTSLTTPEISPAYNIDKEAETKVLQFFNGIMKDDIEDAYKLFLKKSPLRAKKDDMTKLIKETKRAKKYYGKLAGFEFVSAEKVTNSYIRLRYIGVCENYPMRWIFTMYRSPKNGWIVTKILFDDMSEYYFQD